MPLQDHEFMAPSDEFCENLRLYVQYWEKMDNDKIVGYCRKNLLKPVKLRKQDIYKCITGKIDQKNQVDTPQPDSLPIEI
jgi:hypothetical protein